MTAVESPQTAAPAAPVVAAVEHLSFSYGRRRALHDVSFTVRRGEAVALLGHNGAGKTTTIRLMNGLLQPDGGRMNVLGLDPTTQGYELRRRTAVVTDALGLHERDTPRRTFEYHAQLWDLDPKATVKKGMELLDRFGLSDRAEDRIKSLSRGMRQRLAIARALVNEPELILLDEPTLGMDPVARQDFRDLLGDVMRSGVSVIVSTHDLGEVERMCNRLVIMQHGRSMLEGTPQECMRPFMRDVDVEIETDGLIGLVARDALRSQDTLTQLRIEESIVLFRAADVDAISEAVRRVVNAGERVIRVGSHAPSLEDVYLMIHKAVSR